MFNIEKKNKIKKMIKEELNNLYIDLDMLDDRALDDNVDYILEDKIKIIDSKDLKLELSSYFMFIFIEKDDYKDIEKIIYEKIEDYLKTQSLPDVINILFIFRNVKDKIEFIEKIKDKKIKNSIAKKIKLISGEKYSTKKIDYNFLIWTDCYKKKFKVNIASRIKSINIEKNMSAEENDIKIEGYVFTAELFDIVEIYNKLGSELFNFNVRCSIKDELEVDKKIKDTLKNDPDSFWFLNNGITLVIDNNNLDMKKDKLIELSYNESSVLSVINGAQTISTSAEYYYNLSDEDLRKTKNKAQVMCRVIKISSDIEHRGALIQEINRISIALNRQKPIKPEDVAYTVPFVYNINKLYDENSGNPVYFSLVRRGEEKGYDLINFFKMITAYLAQKPGQALNASGRSLLEVKEDDEGEVYFSNSIFKIIPEFSRKDGNEQSFKKYFTPVNFVNRLCDEYVINKKVLLKNIDEEIKMNVENDVSATEQELKNKKIELEIRRSLINYGKWYFVSYIIYVLNNKKCDDFTEFNAKLDGVNLKDYIEEFVDLFILVINESENKITSLSLGDFKKDSLYKEFIECKNKEIISKINTYNDKIINNFR